MTIKEARGISQDLVLEASRVLERLNLEKHLQPLGQTHLTGSYRSGLMVKKDIDFLIFNESPDLGRVADLGRRLINHPVIAKISVADHRRWPPTPGVPKSVYLCIKPVIENRLWQIDVHIMRPKDMPDRKNFPLNWSDKLSSTQKDTILLLKANLYEQGRYPGEYRSADIYRAVINDGVKTIPQLEKWRLTHEYY